MLKSSSKSSVLFPATVLLCTFLFCLNSFAQRAPVPSDPKNTEKAVVPTEAEKGGTAKRIREGTTFQGKSVFFRQTGSRTIVYTTDTNERFVCLENLNLERILKAMADRPGRRSWKIDGMYTEFQGENYIIINRAVVAPTDFTPSPGPENEKPKIEVLAPMPEHKGL